MKPLCIVDTCSLIYLSEIQLAGSSLHQWLWSEFHVGYSQTVWEEIEQNAAKMGQGARYVRRHGEDRIWQLSTITTYESALFAQPFCREIEIGRCKRCHRPTYDTRPFVPDFDSPQDRGERHNCCVALDAVRRGDQRQVVFLTDDLTAVRDYVAPIFGTFPLGHIWSSYDFVLYLFIRHRRRIPQNMIKAVLKDVTAKAVGRRPDDERPEHEKAEWIRRYESWMPRLGAYHRKVERIDQVLSQIGG